MMRYKGVIAVTLVLCLTALVAGRVLAADRPVPDRLPKVAVLPFRGGDGIASSVANAAADTLVNLLVASGKVEVVERSRLEEVMRESSLTATGEVSPETAARMGNLLGAAFLVTGIVREATADTRQLTAYGIASSDIKHRVVVLVRAVDVVTGKVVFSRKASKLYKKIMTPYNLVEEGDVYSPLLEQALGDIAPVLAKAVYQEAHPGPVARFALSIVSEPDAADVEIDGLFEGNCPFAAKVPAGVHHVRVSLPGYEEWAKKVRVEADRTKPIRVKLIKKPQTTEVNVRVDR